MRTAAVWFFCLAVALGGNSGVFAAIDLDAPKSLRAVYTEVAPELANPMENRDFEAASSEILLKFCYTLRY